LTFAQRFDDASKSRLRDSRSREALDEATNENGLKVLSESKLGDDREDGISVMFRLREARFG